MTTAPGRITRAVRSWRARATQSCSYHSLCRRLRTITFSLKVRKIDGFEQDKKMVVIAATNDNEFFTTMLIVASFFGSQIGLLIMRASCRGIKPLS